MTLDQMTADDEVHVSDLSDQTLTYVGFVSQCSSQKQVVYPVERR
jgi:hypothetical protein